MFGSRRETLLRLHVVPVSAEYVQFCKSRVNRHWSLLWLTSSVKKEFYLHGRKGVRTHISLKIF